MKRKYILSVLTFSCATALAQIEPSSSPVTIERAELAFETADRVETKLFVPAKWMDGPLHRVSPQAYNDGLINTYFLSTAGQEYDVATGGALITRIREIYAIEKLRGMSKTDEFKKAMARAGKQKLDSVKGLVQDPFGTIKRVPKGASRFFGRIGESMKGGGSESEGNTLQSVTGVQKAKVALAAKLGVSPYSTNEELQAQLTGAARAMAGGGFIISAATMAVGGPAGDVVSALNVNQTLQAALVNSDPSELRIMNRKKLFALGVTRENADEFLMHPWYSPWHETIVVDALAAIGVDPTAFLAKACQALTEQDASYFQRLAQVLARYHQSKTPLSSIRLENERIAALDSTGTLVIPLSCDYAIWSEPAATRVEAFTQLPQSRSEIKGLALWVDGKVSERAGRELRSRKVDLAADVLAETSKSSQP